MLKNYRLTKAEKHGLSHFDPKDTGGFASKEEIQDEFQHMERKLGHLQDKLFASKTNGVLVLFQGMDCSGKDGVIKKVLSNLNPLGFRAESFKAPTSEESAHDFLWRTHKAVPAKGYITAFNRSYYEDVLITRVHGTIQDDEAATRMKHIRHFEKMLTNNGILLIKIFLHISPEFQLEKIRERLSNPEKVWKFDPSDLNERQYWSSYIDAYEDVFRQTATKYAPWHIVPANERWFRDYVVLQLILSSLEKLDLSYPEPDIETRKLMEQLHVSEPPPQSS
ncbi:PPK2 family polyphosphate:nucleotide phosphotransferase [Paenibacillus taihuensis]|uniref:PPK2 family polyphosphate:nucleotide phosphotransferase n=1 Tax=Paenibacillus taihuensis TaxID=1156355 RepID=A0A3D9RHS8_9BACL|nr:PPK2 family polyphosphate kinase [Paenibacillus taihuensis]REE78639.1 PPK2 family polyphosphate:nucleotide phosphotransferase [Paenibacillus taihuensis]